MKIKIISPANKMPDWVNTACQEFQKRLDNTFQAQFVDIPLNSRGKNADIQRLMEKEAKAMLSKTSESDWVLALTIDGKSHSSESFSSQMQEWQHLGKDLVIFIGGPEGLHPDCIKRANQKLSLSALTLPHPLVRVLLMEQLYRGQCILNGHPYHK